MNSQELRKEIALAAKTTAGVRVIQELDLRDSSAANELLLFMKPELFIPNDQGAVEASVGLVLDKLVEFDVEIRGTMVVSGEVLDAKSIMNDHYGYINRLSRSVSTLLTPQESQDMAALLNVDLREYRILGGHEFLKEYRGENADSLDRLWFTKKSLKMRSGFYLQTYQRGDEKLVLVNGFHPAQLAHYTDPAHRIVLFLLRSNEDWKVLKWNMVGSTFPEKAVPGSIRGCLFAEHARYSLTSVSIANNGVHLSAGPFEALYEVLNFYGRIAGVEPSVNSPMAVRRMLSAGVPMSEALSTLKNPVLRLESGETDLYTATEDLNTSDAIDFWKEHRELVTGYIRP